MPRTIDYSSAEEPILTATDAINDGVVEHLLLRDETGTYADIQAVACKRCGYMQEFATVLGTHRCTTPARTARLVHIGMATFRRISESRRAAGPTATAREGSE